MSALVLNIFVAIIVVLVTALALWIMVPAVFPIAFTYVQAIAAAGLLYTVKAVFSK